MTNTDYKLSLLAMVAESLQAIAIAFSTYAAEPDSLYKRLTAQAALSLMISRFSLLAPFVVNLQ